MLLLLLMVGRSEIVLHGLMTYHFAVAIYPSQQWYECKRIALEIAVACIDQQYAP
jgi:hypothetical protein